MRRKKMVRQAMAQAEAETQIEWQRLEQQLEAESRRLLEAGTPEDIVFAQAYSNMARPFARAALVQDEAVRQELTVGSQVMPGEFGTYYLTVTDMGLIWSPLPKFE